MAQPERDPHRRLTRADLPAELTPDTLRHLDLRTLRMLSRHHNGVLDAEEQAVFDAALAEVTRGTVSLLDESMRRARHGGPANLDPAMRRSYQRTQQRLAEQARRARLSLPTPPGTVDPTTDPTTDPTAEPADPTAEPAEPTTEPTTDTTTDPTTDQTTDSTTDPTSTADDVSPDTLEQQVEQTSQTLDMLERIASLQQQQVEHQHTQLLSETRGFFFAFLVSVAVIIAGVAPLVEAEPHERWLIVIWTLVATAAAGIAYAVVRAVQGRKN